MDTVGEPPFSYEGRPGWSQREPREDLLEAPVWKYLKLPLCSSAQPQSGPPALNPLPWAFSPEPLPLGLLPGTPFPGPFPLSPLPSAFFLYRKLGEGKGMLGHGIY